MKIYNSNKSIKQQFEELDTLPIFEIEVIDKRTNQNEFIIFDISIDNGKFRAEHIALNKEQEQSNKIAFTSVDIDSYFSLDENLQELFDECTQNVIDSEFYELI
jgi:hypothetical protein